MLKKDEASAPLTDQGKTTSRAGLCGEYGILGSNRRRLLFIFGILLIAAAVVLSVTLTHKKEDTNAAVVPVPPIWVSQSRLSSIVVPHHYHLNYLVNLTTLHFDGQVSIELDVTNATDLIILHVGNDMKIQDVAVWGGPNSTYYPPASFFKYDPNEFLVVFMNTTVPAGSYVLNITFDQPLIRGTYGFYRSSYKTLSGETRYLATTQFEPTSARDAFPCFDEPAFKANFSITITCEPQYHALSNMPIQTQTNTSTTRTFEFETSVKMSTYLVAMVVSDFESVSAYTTSSKFGPKLVSIWTHHDQINQTAIALNSSVTMLSYFEELFNFEYPIAKQDFIAIPDYSGGAMENWGLITFEEVSLLFDPLESSQSNEQRIVSVIAHELAHQWFGDLVTMKWWSDTYLNEGFAQYFEYAGTTAARPDWDMFSQFTIIAQQEAQTIDAMVNSHPVIMQGLTTKGIGGMFDDIVYDKGASLNRMMAGFLGDGWINGLKNYLAKYAYGNTLAPDLFAALSAASSPKLDVGTIMSSWTLQSGYPVLTVTQVDGGLQITQNRFFSSPGQTSDTKWHIYVTSLVPSNATVQSTWFQPTDNSIFIPYNSTLDSFIKLDINETGLYRVNYPIPLWNRLTEAMINQTNLLSVSDRTGVLSDVAALAQADLLPYSLALNVTRFLATEHSYVVWKMARDMLDLIGDRLLTTTIYNNWQNYMKNLLVAPYQKIGWNNTDSTGLDKLHRKLILDLACEYSVSDCRQQTTTRFQQFYANNVTTSIDPNIRDVVYRYAIADAPNSTYFDYLYNRYQNVTIPSAEQQRILYALTATKIPAKLNQLLSDALSVKNIRSSKDALNVLEWIAQAGEYDLVWTFITDPNNWSILSTRYSSDSSFGSLIRRVTALFATPDQKKQVQTFLDQRASTLGANSIRSASLALETIQANIDWLTNNEDEITKYLKVWNF